MIDMLKRHEIQVLRRAGHTWAEVAALSGVSVGPARRVAAEAAVATVDNAAERARRQIGRPSKAEAYREVLVQALTEESTLRSVELLHRTPGGLHRWQERVVRLGPDAADAWSRRWYDSKVCPGNSRSTISAKSVCDISRGLRRSCTSSPRA